MFVLKKWQFECNVM